MKRRYKKKKEPLWARVANWCITLALAGVMICGLQCYSDSSLKFVQLSDVHFASNGQNTTFKMTGESPKLLQDAVNQVNEMSGVNFVMFTGDQINTPYEKELEAFMPYAEKLNVPWYTSYFRPFLKAMMNASGNFSSKLFRRRYISL